MRKTFLLISLVWAINIFGQNLKCGVPDEQPQIEMERRQLLLKIKNSPNFQKAIGITYIPIKMHLFGLDDGTGYLDSTNANDGLAELNRQFKPINIEFYFAGSSFNYYPNSIFYNANQTADAENNFHLVYGAKNAINVYASNTVKSPAPDGPTVGGWAYITPTAQMQNRIWVRNDLFNYHTGPHEFGHYFGLLHTFNGSDALPISERELVTRNFSEIPPRLSANCDIKGDYLIDTPSDPFGLANTAINLDCKYVGTAIDANSDLFDPLVSNYMSYHFCGHYFFTAGQLNRMSDGLIIVTNPSNEFTLNAPETIQAPPSDLKATGHYVNISLSWTDNSNVETGYIIERSTNPNGPFVAFKGVGPNVTKIDNAMAEPNVSNYYRVKASNTKNNYSNISNPISDYLLYCSNLKNNYCTDITDPNAASYQIEDFVLANDKGMVLIKNSASGCSATGIGDYFNTYSASIIPGQKLNFTVSSKAIMSSAYNVYVNIYADWNFDNDFDDSNELLFSSPYTLWQVMGQFAIPDNISAGNIRLRIVLSIYPISNACDAYGEIEDYKLVYDPLNSPDFTFSEEIKIFPNPAKTILNLKAQPNNPIDKIIISDLAGKVIKTQIDDTTQVDVQNLAKGMYIIQVFSGQMRWQRKFIKE